jgi:hypothetical protein
MRKTVAAVGSVLILGVCAPRVGQPDRTESMAIGGLRAIVSGEQAYASANGYYDTPACLAEPSCVPGVDRPSDRFLAPDVTPAIERQGYRLVFHAGPKAGRLSERQRSPSAMTRFAVAAVPVNVYGAVRRAFCADDRGTIYFTSEAAGPRVDEGRCVDTTHPLR